MTTLIDPAALLRAAHEHDETAEHPACQDCDSLDLHRMCADCLYYALS